MSLHLMDCAKPLQLQPSMKLALMAFADSAGDRDRIGHPGLEAVMKWACVGRSQASDLIKALVAEGLLRKHSRGHKGRNARYVVFPRGCCDAHGTATAPAGETGLRKVAAALGVDLTPDQLAGLQALADDTTEEVARATPQVPAHRSQPESEGSGPPDSSGGNGSTPPDPFSDEGSASPAPDTQGTSPASPAGGVDQSSGAGEGPADRHRFLGFKASPPTPHASGAGGACPAHQPTPAENCRGCGTTPRQIRAAAARQAAEQTASQAGPRCPGGHRWAADGSCGCPPPVEHPSRVELEDAVAS